MVVSQSLTKIEKDYFRQREMDYFIQAEDWDNALRFIKETGFKDRPATRRLIMHMSGYDWGRSVSDAQRFWPIIQDLTEH